MWAFLKNSKKRKCEDNSEAVTSLMTSRMRNCSAKMTLPNTFRLFLLRCDWIFREKSWPMISGEWSKHKQLCGWWGSYDACVSLLLQSRGSFALTGFLYSLSFKNGTFLWDTNTEGNFLHLAKGKLLCSAGRTREMLDLRPLNLLHRHQMLQIYRNRSTDSRVKLIVTILLNVILFSRMC